MQFSLTTALVVLAAIVGAVVGAEMHTVRFNNICGVGTPMLIQGEDVLSHGEPYTADGPLNSTIAQVGGATPDNSAHERHYRPTDVTICPGECGFNGENCTLIETALENLSPDGSNSGSLTDINVRSPHKFNVAASFSYVGGCEGDGAFCNGPNCNPAPVSCEVDNVNLTITFCVKPVPRAARLGAARYFAKMGPGRNV
ncbi:hypothetical protein GSI_05559 [Ganoderma sinense ZZ0214-1]|uniref:Uncharacterized protein n=1 Tax=Ganoderma sinense ZZ0214-1 TaxID=1077348 RepID=A0A2G8SEY2_9APHY|nr:hypothetical protein GSI_05559 [Ganoderma sinense ZZ0214-1]